MTYLNKEDIIKRYGPNPDKWDWFGISCMPLSEDFIREFKDKVDWDDISVYQKLSENFINEFKDKINMRFLVSYNPSCSPDLRIKYLKDNNLIKKQDPSTHEIEYETIPMPKPNNSNNSNNSNDLKLLKELIED